MAVGQGRQLRQSCGEQQEEPESKADRKQKRVRTAEKAGKDTRAAPGPPER